MAMRTTASGSGSAGVNQNVFQAWAQPPIHDASPLPCSAGASGRGLT